MFSNCIMPIDRQLPAIVIFVLEFDNLYVTNINQN